jgi:hypothetical protein
MRNSLFEHLEHSDDGKHYAVNITLKSGSVVYLEGLKKGEKDSYLAYAKTGKDPMILTGDKNLWRILPSDIEKIDVKAYGDSYAKGVYPFMKIFMAKSRMQADTFFSIARIFIVVVLLAIIAGAAQALKDGDLLNLIFEKDLLAVYIATMMGWIEQGFLAILAMLVFANLIDFILMPVDQFHILENNRHFLSGTKTLHVLITLGFILFFLVFKSAAAVMIRIIN